MNDVYKNQLISIINEDGTKKDITKKAYDLIQNIETKDEIRSIITFLNSDELNKEKDGKKNKNRKILIEKFQQSISQNYLDYDIDNFVDLFFPKAIEEEEEDVDAVKENDGNIETNEEYNTYMYAYPLETNQLKQKKKDKKQSQEGNPFGFDISVHRKDSQNVVLSEMLGIELWLFILNQSGSNANYMDESYYQNKEPNPYHVNNYKTKKVYKIKQDTNKMNLRENEKGSTK